MLVASRCPNACFIPFTVLERSRPVPRPPGLPSCLPQDTSAIMVLQKLRQTARTHSIHVCSHVAHRASVLLAGSLTACCALFPRLRIPAVRVAARTLAWCSLLWWLSIPETPEIPRVLKPYFFELFVPWRCQISQKRVDCFKIGEGPSANPFWNFTFGSNLDFCDFGSKFAHFEQNWP